jgi:7,8-dihydropterin-6-yl-methyl-4-(beta-D-ribofuranosyl)aminobenzene 5'-phosphate synthase
MNKIESFGEARNVEITVLVDNRADLMVKSTDTVKRFNDEPLLAEHGFAALVDLTEVGARILWDAGITSIALLENARHMEIDLATIDKVALSHGHGDHYAALTDVLKAVVGRPRFREWDRDVTEKEIIQWMESRRMAVVAHPAAFRERWHIDKEGKKHGPGIIPRDEWEAAGANVVLSAGPHALGPGCWTTGAVPRRSFEKAGMPRTLHYRQSNEFVRDNLDDDQSIVINVKDKGLVVLTGCAHSGVVNTVNYAREISGVDQVHAVLGGFHLAPANDEEIQQTIDAIKALKPAVIAPSHCTGFKAISEFSRQMPDEFVLATVGTKYLF